MSKKEREAVVFLNDHMKMARDALSDKELGRLYEALRAYAMEGETPDLTREKKIYISVWNLMKASQDKYLQKYEETCERNRQRALKRWNAEDADGSRECQSNTIQYNQNKSNRTQSKDYETIAHDEKFKGKNALQHMDIVWA